MTSYILPKSTDIILDQVLSDVQEMESSRH